MNNIVQCDLRFGIDLGGTKTEIIGLEARNGKEVYRHRVPTPKNYDDTIRNMADMVRMAEQTLGRAGTLGMGIPGSLSQKTGLVRNANSVWLNGKPLDRDMSDVLNGREVRVENDANCLAVSEATDGAGAGKKCVFAVIIGTGCGAGIAIDQKPIGGLNGISGEWGHNPLPFPKTFMGQSNRQDVDAFFEQASNNNFDPSIYPRKLSEQDFFTDRIEEAEYPGTQCYCGRRGCLETWISGQGLKADHARVTDEVISTHDIIARAGQGDAACHASVRRYTSRLARGLAGVVNILDPDIIILGGGMSNVSSLYDDLPDMMAPFIFLPNRADIKIVSTLHGDSSGVRGAAWLWPMIK